MKKIENRISKKLIAEWNYKKNKGLKPDEFTRFSNKKVWWKCKKCGYEWPSIINNRSKGNGCPCCAGKIPLVGKTDLATVNPELIKEWDYEKNLNKPQDYLPNSSKKVWWKCRFGHSWEAVISSRNAGRGCPECSRIGTSFPEQAIYYYTKQLFSDATNRSKVEGVELDIFIPSIKVAIEYDGFVFHNNEKQIVKDNRKDYMCEEINIVLLRVRENGLRKTNSAKNFFLKDNSNEELTRVIKVLLSKLPKTSKKISVDVDRDILDIKNQYYTFIKKNSLAEKYPNIAREWDYEKNKGLTPEMLFSGTHQKVWWICPKKHSYYASIANRTNNGRNCPYCSNQKVLKGFNDLATINPLIAKEWSYKLNNGLTPEDVTSKTHKKVWWKCSRCGNDYYSSVAFRSSGGGCNICNGDKAKEGYNDFLTVAPHLEKEIHPTKNKDIDYKSIRPKSDKKLWWICDKGHIWESMVKKRVLGQGCPFCSNKKVWEGFNDLATKNPELAKEWNFNKNKGLMPTDVMSTSNKKANWKCQKCGYKWSAFISNRSRGAGCPRCNGRVPFVGKNDLATVNPELVKDWNYDKNTNKPQDYLPYSHKKVWWKCSKCGNEWEAIISSRMNGKCNCKKCEKRNKE